MNIFDQKLKDAGYYPLRAREVVTLQTNIGYKCNLSCTHCHVEASPDRAEMMSLSTVYRLIDVLRKNREITTVDITGGSPELNPHFAYFVEASADMGKNVMVRSNLAIYSENRMSFIPEFLAKNKTKVIGSLPCYTQEGVEKVRGKGTYEKAIAA